MPNASPIVTPIEPHLRRRDGVRPRTVVERGVAIPVHRELPPSRVMKAPASRAMSEGALAARFFPLAIAVAAVDLATKAWAASALTERTVTLSSLVSLSLAYNRASAGGVWIGEHTRELNFAATGAVVGMIVILAPVLARLHRHAWIALALITGAGLGNMYSLVSATHGVVDFIALRRPGGTWVLNVADVALAAGLLLLAAVVATVSRTVRHGGGRVRMR